ncbi:hypothetical protein U0070_017160 [Myodes glareolus]|uniref:Uncharacterized protein n=1 Tax=Myodes glareolus TaxID=447135 RepID=A0AAW0HWL1_MYOGA
MSYKPNLTAHMRTAALNAGSVHSPSTNMATSSQYRQLLSDYGPPSLGYTQGTGNSQVPQSKYAELLAIIEELGERDQTHICREQELHGETKMKPGSGVLGRNGM